LTHRAVDKGDMRAGLILTAGLTFLAAPAGLYSQETVYPAGAAVENYYLTSSVTLSLGDTLTITRVLVNHESFDLSGLYFSDNLPPEFQVVAQSVEINGATIDYGFSDHVPNLVIPGLNCYHWVLDSPDGSENIHNLISPDDSVVLEVKIVATDVGNFVLPLHTSAFFGNSAGFFSTSGPISVDVILSVGIQDDFPYGGEASTQQLVCLAFPNPFNPQVTISYRGADLAGRKVHFEVFNILGQQVFSRSFVAGQNEGTITWLNDGNLGSGTYFYRISTDVQRFVEKVTLLK